MFRTSCTGCGRTLEQGFQPFCPGCGGIADIEYDMARVRLRDSPNPYVRFRDLLPVADPSLLPPDAEVTPTVHATRLGRRLGLPWLYLKDETKLPTGTTKDRMAAVALPYLRERGVRAFCTSSTGNSSTSYAHAIGRSPGLVMHLFTPSRFLGRLDLPDSDQVIHYLLPGASFVEAFEAARLFAESRGLTAERGFFNPGRREGLKLAWLEAAEQVMRPIDWYVQAVSSAMGVYGVWGGARQLYGLKRIDKLPRLLCVQQETCAPMVAAWEERSAEIQPEHVVLNPTGIAEAILRGDPSRAYPHVHRVVVESGGAFVAVSEGEIRQAARWVEELEGIKVCFAAAAAVAGLARSVRNGALDSRDVVLVNLTGMQRLSARRPKHAHVLARSEQGWIEDRDTLAVAR